MGRGVEDLSGRCHVKRMSRRKERLGFLCNSVFARKKKGETHTRTLLARTRSLTQAAPSYYLLKCISLQNYLHSRGLCDSRQRLSVPVRVTNSGRGEL